MRQHLILLALVWQTSSTQLAQAYQGREVDRFRQREFANRVSMHKSSQRASASGQNINVTYYGLNITVQQANPRIIGSVRIEGLILADNVTSVTFDVLTPLAVDSVLANGIKAIILTSSSTVQIETAVASKGTTVAFDIFYHGTPVTVPSYGYVIETVQPGTTTPWFMTNSEPYGAPNWWPCKDDPGDKADSLDVWVTCDERFKVGSEGKLVSVTPAGSGKHTYHWSHRYPISSYLVSVSLTNYAEFSDWFKYSPTDSMQILNYVLPADSAQVRSQLAKTVSMLEVFSKLLGLYPFVTEKYGHAQVTQFWGEEHQTMTSLGTVGLSGFLEWMMSHELAHQWFGDMITMGSWSDLWLNEGFASYAEALYSERAYGKHSYDSTMNSHMLDAKLANGSVFVADTLNQSVLFAWGTVYRKGSTVLHMLRHVLGDSVFFGALKGYATNPKFMYRNTSTQDFQKAFEDYSGKNLDYFFQEWIYGVGYPIYTYKHAVDSAASGFTSNVRIIQTAGRSNPSIFTMPIDLKFSSAGWDTTVTVFNNVADQTFSIALSHKASSVQLDPDLWILRDATFDLNWTGVANGETPYSFELSQNYPNPFNPSTVISFQLPVASNVSLKVFDLLGREVAMLVNEEKPAGAYQIRWNASNAQSGVYVCRIIVGDPSSGSGQRYVETRKMVLVR
ncbi:MAG: M1 family aminopeptidase [Bacteroidota bacterium]